VGLLDDAIREHLELKRRHGADPGEVERQESEVLGAVPEEPAAEAGPAAVVAPQPAPEPEEDVREADAPEAEESEPAPELDPAPQPDDTWLEDEQERARAPAPAPEREPEPSPEPAAESEDVLEETPEFLEETLEHERLWFEQRPPRDFDFDR